MTVRTAIAVVLLAGGVALQLFAVAGVVAMRDPFDRLHYAAAATTFGPFLIVAALLVEGTAGEILAKATIVAVVLVLFNPVLTHATGRAARMRAEGSLEPHPDEIESAEPAR